MTAAPETTKTARAPRRARDPIAVGLSRFPTVTETFILREVTELERQGQPVRLVPLIKDTPAVVHEEAKAWTERALYTPFLSARIVTNNLATLVRKPVRYTGLLLKLIGGTLLSPATLVRTLALFPKSVYLALELKKEGIAHIHVHYATHPATMALIIASLSDITFSFTVHAHDIQVERSLLRWKLRETQFVRSISRFNKEFLEKLYPAEAAGKIVVIHVGIDPATYENSGHAITPATTSPPRILCVAAHRPYKGIPVLIEACRILRDAGVSFRCDVVGSGPMTAELQRLIRKRALDDLFHLAGPQPQHEVARMMREASVFVLPSIIARDGQMEGIPVALMEAMATGKPVVSTAISGIPELVEDGVNGYLAPPGDAQELADAIRRVLADPAGAQQMGSRGQQKVRDEFTLADSAAQLMQRLAAETRS